MTAALMSSICAGCCNRQLERTGVRHLIYAIEEKNMAHEQEFKTQFKSVSMNTLSNIKQ